MNAFVLEHADFARWLLLTLLLGLPVVAAWAVNFRRLSRTGLPPAELVWEARRGLLGGALWLAALLCELLLLLTSYEITVVEVIAISDEVGAALVQNIERGREMVVGPAVLVLGLAAGALLAAAWASGAARVLAAGGGRRG